MSKAKQRIPKPYIHRLATLRVEMERRSLDAYLIQNRMDQLWVTGFTGEDGATLVTRNQVVLLTDGRFDETADIEAPWARKVIRKKRTPEVTAKELTRRRLQNVGFDPGHMSVDAYGGLRKAAKPTKLVAASGVIARLRECKDAGEVELLRRSIRVAEKAFQRIERWVRPGMTEREVAAKLVYEMQRLGAQGPGFEPIVAVGANASLPHYMPGDAKLGKNDILLIDWGARVDWYISDLTRVIRVGSIPRELAKVYDIVREAHDRAIAGIKAGVKTAEIDRAARSVISKAGYGKRFNHGLGHGIGLNVHEAPRLGKGAADVLRSGMVVTIEPGIYLPGRGGIRIESDVLVTDDGAEVLSSLPY